VKVKTLDFFLILLLICNINFSQRIQNNLAIKDSIFEQSKRSLRLKRLINDPLTPSKAAFYSAIIPGLGQAYLGKAWKIPIIYSAIGASLYYFDLNNKEMNEYRNAYKRRLNGFFDDRFLELAIPITTEQLLLGMEFHKNYRDIALVLAALSYMLNILEANVSAHLLQFNVSEDLSVTPNLIIDEEIRGLRLALKF
jgi:TM2 domain-containing membrane protein YozV